MDAPAWIDSLIELASSHPLPKVLTEADYPPLRLKGEEEALPPAVSFGLIILAQEQASSGGAEQEPLSDELPGLDFHSARMFTQGLVHSWVAHGASAKWMRWLEVLAHRFPSSLIAEHIMERLGSGYVPRDQQTRLFDFMGSVDLPEAFYYLNRFSENGTGQELPERGKRAARASREHFDLTREEYQDLCMPTLGIGASGVRELDYGPRTVRIRVVQGEVVFEDTTHGKVYKNLPRARIGDAADKAELIRRELQPSVKILRANIKRARARLQRDMIGERSWRLEHVTGRLLAHPVSAEMMRGLVWLLGTRDGEPILARPDEEGVFIDVDMEPVSLEDVTHIRIARIADFGDQLAQWVVHMEDFEVVQPIDQLSDARFVPDGPIVAELMRSIEEGTFFLDVRPIKRLLKDDVITVDGKGSYHNGRTCKVGVVNPSTSLEIVAITGDLHRIWKGWKKAPIPVMGIAQRQYVEWEYSRAEPQSMLDLAGLQKLPSGDVVAFFKTLASLRHEG